MTAVDRLVKVWTRVWTSPTLMTWGSHLSSSLSLLLVVPLILTRLHTADIALWYLFSTMIVLEGLVDIGFSPTFTRVLAYAIGGRTPHQLRDLPQQVVNTSGEPNWQTIAEICATMRVIYTRLTLAVVVALGTFGTWAVTRPIAQSQDATTAWMAWGVILLGSTVVLRGNTYSAYLQGMNQIALLRRWEALTGLGAALTSFSVLLLGGGLLGLVIAHQSWMILSVLRNRWLCRALDDGRFRTFSSRTIHADVMRAVWPSAWRSGLGVAMSHGLIQLSGVIYAQLGATDRVATYLLSLRFIDLVSRFSRAPFYSKLPLLARLHAQGNTETQVQLARRGMTLSHWSFVVGFIGLGLFAPPLLVFIRSNATFADPMLWTLLGAGILVERYGAMHIQLYSTTNHIIWHIANGVSGVIYVLVSLLLYRRLGVYAFPLGILVAYLGFYSWYAAKHSYQRFNLRFWSFERRPLLQPLSVMTLYVVVQLLWDL